MRALRALAALAAFLLSVFAFVLADSNTGLVYVTVQDGRSGKPAPGWTVQLTARDGDQQRISDRNGNATFLTVTPGMARIDVLQKGQLAVCPAVIMISANQQTVIHVHAHKSKGHHISDCSPAHSQTMVKPGVTADVYDIY
jgi:uncharacterized protein YfaS (alpha-2-macroglobulin family)